MAGDPNNATGTGDGTGTGPGDGTGAGGAGGTPNDQQGAQGDGGTGSGSTGNGGDGGQGGGGAGGADGGGGGTQTPNPWDGLDDDLKAFVGEKTPADVAKELQGAQTLLGKKTIGIPTAESTPEEWARFHEARGVPGSADKYDFTAVRDEALKDIPADQREAAWDKDEEQRFRELAKSSNLSQTEANELMKRELAFRMEKAKKEGEENAAQAKIANDLVTEHWGNKTPEYTQDANNLFRHLGIGDDALAAIQKLDNVTGEARFKLIEMARIMGGNLREGGQPGRQGGGIPVTSMTAEQADAAKEEYLNTGDNRKAYMEPQHPRHKEVTNQVTEYLKITRAKKQ